MRESRSDPTMSLRIRLIIAFLLLSVVPLSAVTAYSYLSTVAAFESAARREATETATDVSNRMELITADVGRRMDRLFVEASAPAEPQRRQPDAGAVRARVAPMLGDAAALVERVEYEPMPPQAPQSTAGTGPDETSAPARSGHPAPPLPPPPGGHVPTPPPPGRIVIDVPGIIAEAQRAAREGGAADAAGLGRAIRGKLQGLPNEPQLEAFIEGIAPEVAARARDAERTQMDVQGRRVDVSVRKGGHLVGKARATLNMDRTLKTVLTFAKREKGEIPFAIDTRGRVYTPDSKQEATLRALDVERLAPKAAGSGPQRVGDWILVARKDAGGITFGIARPVAESLREIRRASVRNLSLGLGVIVLALIGIVPISGRMTQHLSSLSAGVHQLAGGDFRARVPVRSNDEFGALATAFNQMAADLERHQSLIVEQERLRKELELSRLIQTEMLPRTPLTSGPAEIKGVSIPAREVGGDFFNYFVLPDGRLALLVGDVSGKGVSAALLMANVQATLRARLPLESDLARLAGALDHELDRNTPPTVYLTLFLAILDSDARVLHYVNAGHNPQFVLRAGGGIRAMSSTGLPIALFAGHGYTESRVELAPGDLLFFYTDGLVETESESGEMFGAERLQALLVTEQAAGIDRVLERIENEVRAFRGSAEPFDDATMMALRVTG
jgi:serine phosphatase RsbU (regulator of sigma subunit)